MITTLLYQSIKTFLTFLTQQKHTRSPLPTLSQCILNFIEVSGK